MKVDCGDYLYWGWTVRKLTETVESEAHEWFAFLRDRHGSSDARVLFTDPRFGRRTDKLLHGLWLNLQSATLAEVENTGLAHCCWMANGESPTVHTQGERLASQHPRRSVASRRVLEASARNHRLRARSKTQGHHNHAFQHRTFPH